MFQCKQLYSVSMLSDLHHYTYFILPILHQRSICFFFFLEFYSFECFIEMNELCDMHSKCCFDLLWQPNTTSILKHLYYYFVPKAIFCPIYYLFTKWCCDLVNNDTISSIHNITSFVHINKISFWNEFHSIHSLLLQ